jgi:hypothetical protein
MTFLLIFSPDQAFLNHAYLNPGASRDRTDDPLLAKQMLSQLSYGPRTNFRAFLWAWVDLNHRPHAYQACALTN